MGRNCCFIKVVSDTLIWETKIVLLPDDISVGTFNKIVTFFYKRMTRKFGVVSIMDNVKLVDSTILIL